MSKFLFKSLLCSPLALSVALSASGAAVAVETKIDETTVEPSASLIAAPEAGTAPVFSSEIKAPVQVSQLATEETAQTKELDTSSLEQVNRYSREGRNTQAQVTSVSQLSDVRPTDWAFQALQSLVERYGCIAGYPDRTYRGNQAMTRYEFAAGLNACLDRINELIAASTADLVKKEDLDALRKLQEEFAAELATLRGRVDSLEARTTTLEKQQFSTTTKLTGEVIFAVTDEFIQDGRDTNTVFQDRVRLLLNTSFSGRDLLVTRLDAGNAGIFDQPGVEGTQTFNLGDTDNDVVLGWLAYYFPIGEKGQVYIPAWAGLWYDVVPTQSGLMEAFDGGNGPLSYFAQRNPIYAIGGGTGIAASIPLGPVKISGGYMADNASSPLDEEGLFNGDYSAMGQISFDLGESFTIAATYVNAYRRDSIFDAGLPGSPLLGSALDDDLINPGNSATVNAYGVSAAFKFSPSFSINAFGTYVNANIIGDGAPNADFWTFGGGVAIADLFTKGSLLGVAAGVQPYLGNASDFGVADNDMPIHLEGFYKLQINDFISITPGVIYIINPGQSDSNDDILIGTLRTTFTF